MDNPFLSPRENSVLPADLRTALKARREMFSETASVLPDLHRALRAAALEKPSLRRTLQSRLAEWGEALFGELTGAGALRYAGAAAAVALALFVGLQESWHGQEGAPLLTLAAPAGSNSMGDTRFNDRVDYAMNDVGTQPLSLDQKIDRVVAQGPDVKDDSASARYILTSTPASYDSVVAF
jgi:hypothetical protein